MAAGVGTSPGAVLLSASINGFIVTNQVRHVAVFEDIKKPYTVIQAQMIDNGDLLNNIPVKEQSQFSVSFGQLPDQPPYTGTWILSTVKVHKPADSLRTTYWSLQGYSPHMFSLPRLQKSYHEIPMSSVVQDLVTSYLPGLIKPFSVRAPSRNMAGNINMPHVVNNQQVMAAIRKAMQASASAVDLSSVYLLFENKVGLWLDTLEHLLTSPMGTSGVYWQRLLGTNFLQDAATIQSTILTYRKDDMLDTTALIQAKAQTTSAYDIATQVFQTGLSSIGAAASGAGSAISQIAYNMFRPPSFAAQVAAPRRLMAARGDSQAVTVQVLLNPALTVGSNIVLNMIGATGDVQKNPKKDWQSGNFLISESRHEAVLTDRGMTGASTVRGIPQTVLSA